MINELVAIVGKEWVRAGEAGKDYSVDGLEPKVVVWPGSVEEVAEVLRRADESRWAVAPAGHGSALSFGNPPERLDVVVATTRLNRVLDFEPADLTASVQASCSLAEFNEVVSKAGQWLPLDPPAPERATLGAIAAVDDFGPLRHGYGLMREYVIGLQVALAEGTLMKSGGRVVKNVAGYDLNKLFVGSLGTLGIITQLNVKLRPLPEIEGTCVLLSRDIEKLHRAALELQASELQPAAVCLHSDRAIASVAQSTSGNHSGLFVRFLGSEVAVNYQVDRLSEIARRHSLDVDLSEDTGLWRSIADHPARSTSDLVIRVSVFPSDVGVMFKELEANLGQITDDFSLVAHHGCGVIFGFAQLDLTRHGLQSLAGSLRAWRARCRERGGQLVLERAPVDLKRLVEVWGEVGASAKLMRALKEKFDPHRILNPGRFVGGI